MRPVPALLALALLLVAGCGAAATTAADDEPKGVPLKSLCPGVHLAVDALVVSDPTSRTVFADQVRRLSRAARGATRTTLAPLVDAAEELVRVRTEQDFFVARDDVHAAVVQVDGGCVAAGSPILHGGPHQAG
ncbi:hypothetical protein [Marmoricola sp. RAF53]|uniref:hypothetical protein n=1 Tax=Marmoricola sp. RAF53 TaxID=3233059 RepID=UPI003F94E2A4